MNNPAGGIGGGGAFTDQDKIIQISVDSGEDCLYNAYGLGESGKLYGLKVYFARDKDGAIIRDENNDYVYERSWFLLLESPSK